MIIAVHPSPGAVCRVEIKQSAVDFAHSAFRRRRYPVRFETLITGKGMAGAVMDSRFERIYSHAYTILLSKGARGKESYGR